jgi:hypothetical protein
MNFTNQGTEKARIYNRLVKTATNLLEWQNSDIQILDPLVALFFGTCADEFDRLYQELGTYQSRILERLSSLLLPEINKNPKPCHGVAFAFPDSGVQFIGSEYQFYLKKLQSGVVGNFDNQVDVYFSPAGESKILDINLKYAVYGRKAFKVDQVFYKEQVAELPYDGQSQTTIWLGIAPGQDFQTLEELSLFFDWPSLTVQQGLEYASYLKNTKFSIDGKAISVSNGLRHFSQSYSQADSPVIFEPTFDPLLFTTEYYSNRFITFVPDQPWLMEQEFPFPLEFSRNSKVAQMMGAEKLIWLRIDFEPSTPAEAINELLIVPNAFPVVNRRKNDFTYRLQNNLNLVPIEPDNDFFLGIDNVTDGNGNLFKSVRNGSGGMMNGSFIVRKGGIDRFDSRDARSMLNHVIDLLRQENSAFRLMGYDAISQLLLEMEQLINALDLKVNKFTNRSEETTYLFVKPIVNNDNLYVSYWSTHGEFANLIKVGSQMSVYSGSGIARNGVTFCTNTIGGKDPLLPSESLDAFKNALLTRDRIISRSDIKHFCKASLGNRLKEVGLEEIFRSSKEACTGFEKVTMVRIKLWEKPVEETGILAQTLKTRLEMASSLSLKFEVNIGYD